MRVFASKGICRKVKVGYLLVSHTHCDGDADIGVTATHLCTQSLQTFERFAEEAQRAWKDGSRTIVKRYFLNFSLLSL